MNLLLCNDDGINAVGIQTLYKAFLKNSKVNKLMLVAPDENRSGSSNSLTLDKALRVKKHSENQFSIDGTPTDCVHLALTGLFNETPSMVISGINKFANLGDDTLYSGTVAAAVEGRFLGYPSIAVSLCGDKHFDSAAKVVIDIFTHCLEKPLKKSIILNINVPDVPYEKICGYEITRLGSRHISRPLIKNSDSSGEPLYWIGPSGDENDNQVGTDFYAISQNRVSVTPLTSNMTDINEIEYLANWL